MRVDFQRVALAMARLPLGLVLVLATACERNLPVAKWVADCPAGRIFIATGSDTVQDIPVASDIDEIPEYHDCQRFRDSGPDYGPLVAIWAASNLRAVPAAPVPDSAYAVAEIYNFGRGDYLPLSIKLGFSCLYLRYRTYWEAKLVPLGDDPKPCRETVAYSSIAGHSLVVHPRDTPTGLTEADIPPVVRWDYDSVNARQFIGIRCGGQWCDIGQHDLTPSPAYSLDAASPNSRNRELSTAMMTFASTLPDADRLRRRVLQVKGWYDEQRLGVEAGPGMKSTEIVGTAIPHPALGLIQDDDYSNGWVPSAFVHVTAPYIGKLRFARGVSMVSICRGPTCEVRTPVGCPTTVTPADPGQWWARIEGADGSVQFRCVDRMTHSVIPADAARWRWTETDEKLWVRCTAGCCTVN